MLWSQKKFISLHSEISLISLCEIKASWMRSRSTKLKSLRPEMPSRKMNQKVLEVYNKYCNLQLCLVSFVNFGGFRKFRVFPPRLPSRPSSRRLRHYRWLSSKGQGSKKVHELQNNLTWNLWCKNVHFNYPTGPKSQLCTRKIATRVRLRGGQVTKAIRH